MNRQKARSAGVIESNGAAMSLIVTPPLPPKHHPISFLLLLLLPGCDSGERGGGQVEHDTALLQGHLHQELQEDHRRRLPREAHHVSGKKRHDYSIQLKGEG